MIGNGSNYGVYEWGNGEAEYYKSENATVADGALSIACKKENNVADNKTYAYSSVRLRTAGKVSTTYGRVEARIALPNVVGMWPAFWMLPEKNYLGQGWPYSGEIDIMENKGRQARITSGALHYSNSAGHTYKTNTSSLSSPITDYHVYAIEWTKDAIRWFVDDVQFLIVRKEVWHPSDSTVYATSDDAPFNQPFHVILNLAVGGQFDGYALPPDSLVPCEMKVDYVRIYDANV